MKNKRTPIPQTQVLEWLQKNHPTLHAQAEVDRSWVWLPVDLRSDEPTRTAIKAYGFVYSKRGGHPLPSGKLGTWGHSCDTPLPFYRKKKGAAHTTTHTTASEPVQPEHDAELDEAYAFANS